MYVNMYLLTSLLIQNSLFDKINYENEGQITLTICILHYELKYPYLHKV